MSPQISIYAIIAAALILFATNVIRYDLVAMVALLACVFAGLVDPAESFAGFSNQAVVTVAAVLVISRGLQNAGVVRTLSAVANRVGENPTIQVLTMTGLTALMSAFINNVGALALLMPVAIEMARKSDRSSSYLLMPMAFGSLLGGMTTLIGTPPNLIIANFRTRYADAPFGMFDFSPAGVGVAVAGVLFIGLFGWRLVPRRKSQNETAIFEIENYMVDFIVTDESPAVGQRLHEFVSNHENVDVLAVVRGERLFDLRNRYLKIRSGDILRARSDQRELQEVVEQNKFRISGDKPHRLESNDMKLVEAVVTEGSTVLRRTVTSLQLRNRHGANMVAMARRGEVFANRLKNVRFKIGDVLLLQIPTEGIGETLSSLRLLPLAQRDIPLGQTKRLLVSLTLFGLAITASAMGIVPTAVAFVSAALALVLTRIVPVRELYEQIDWPIIVLLGAMIPVGGAFESSGAAASLSDSLVGLKNVAGPVALLAILMIVTMILSDILNNAATAIVMAPVAIGLAQNLGVSPDAFLLGVAIASSCAFLTPIGHQSNTLVMGPGGYRFSDYIWMGIWVEIIVLVVSVPLLIWFFPLEIVDPASGF